MKLSATVELLALLVGAVLFVAGVLMGHEGADLRRGALAVLAVGAAAHGVHHHPGVNL